MILKIHLLDYDNSGTLLFRDGVSYIPYDAHKENQSIKSNLIFFVNIIFLFLGWEGVHNVRTYLPKMYLLQYSKLRFLHVGGKNVFIPFVVELSIFCYDRKIYNQSSVAFDFCFINQYIIMYRYRIL